MVVESSTIIVMSISVEEGVYESLSTIETL